MNNGRSMSRSPILISLLVLSVFREDGTWNKIHSFCLLFYFLFCIYMTSYSLLNIHGTSFLFLLCILYDPVPVILKFIPPVYSNDSLTVDSFFCTSSISLLQFLLLPVSQVCLPWRSRFRNYVLILTVQRCHHFLDHTNVV